MPYQIYFFIISLSLLFSACRQSNVPLFDIKKEIIADRAAVVTAHPLASKIGLDIIKKGGNAIDAAIATQFALAVTYPVAGNIGGGGFMIIRLKNGETTALDFREQAPATATRDMYLDSLGNVIDGLSTKGHLAAGVPGSVDGMFKAFEKYSQLKDFKLLIAPSIELAKKGFRVTELQAKRLNKYQDLMIKHNTTMPVFVKKGGWKKGDLLVQKDLAQTLQQIHDHGEAGFYEGEIADKIVAEMKAGNGIISHQDLKNYNAIWRKPIQGDYKNYSIIAMPPPSSGGIALLQLLEMVEPYPIKSWGFQSTKVVHLMAEAERRVYADRATHLGDADFYPVPVASLLDEDYLKNRMNNFDESQVSSSDSVVAGKFTMPKESDQTTHFSIVDTEGNAVSLTTTINAWFGSKTVVSGAGFFLNNEMDDFSAKPGVSNFYGLIGAEANAIEPGKRMLSSMTPTIVEKDDQLFMIVGTPGGATIITSVFQTILNAIEFDMTASEAVNAKRFHHQWKPDLLQFEKETFSPEKLESLKELGHQFKIKDEIGRVEAIIRKEDGTLDAAADIRGDDHAEGW